MKEEKKSGGGSQRVDVEIYGEIYHLRTDDPEGLAQLVQIVDSTMKSVARTTRTLAGSHIAVMSALKIAEDYLQLKKDYDELLALLDDNK